MPWTGGPTWILLIILSELTENRAINQCFIINHCICQFVTPISAYLGLGVASIFNFSNITTWMVADFAHLIMVIASHVPPEHRAAMLITGRPREVSGKRFSPVSWCPHEHRPSCGTWLWSTSNSRMPAKQVQGCLHPSAVTDLFSTAQELRIRSISRVNTVYFGARSVWENTFPISREEFSQFTNCSMFTEF